MATMTTTMLGLLGVVLFDLDTQTQLTKLADFNVHEVEGKWYLAGIATDAEWFQMNKGMVKMSVTHVTPTDAGDLHLNNSFMIAEDPIHVSCVNMYHFLKKTETPGKFTFYSSYFQVMNEVNVVDVKYDEYIITQNKRSMNENLVLINNLYTRKPEVSSEVKKKFIQFSLKQLTSTENIVILPDHGECD